ncbi:MAG: trypsin-like peptidase domain-containing protein [Bacteroidetes bacterium]|nr:trypsin-like peptidase domain-containing protein [Bacteroidota bacterium]
MSKKLFFVGVLVAALVGGVVAIAGVSFLLRPQNADSFDEKQKSSFVNLLSGGDFTVPDGINFIASAELVTPAVVHVKSEVGYTSRSQRDPIQEFFGIPEPGMGPGRPNAMPISSGSGVIISPDGYIVTNNHVIEGATRVDISLDNNKRYEATVIGTDPTTDLALLKIEGDNLPFIKFGDSDQTKIGEWVLAVGNPFDLNSTVTAGIISAKARNIGILRDVENNLQIESFLQTDAVVNPGNSGGALVNLAGELIGINTAIASSTGTFNGYSFAIPSTLVKKVMDDLLKYGAVQRGLLGVQIQNVSPELADYLGKKFPVEQGVYVGGVNENSAGEEAGLKEGDIIVSLDGKPVNNVANLQELVARKRPGDEVIVSYLRDGKTLTTTATLKNFSGDTNIVKREEPKTFNFEGIQFEDVKQATKDQLQIAGGAVIKSNANEAWRAAGARNGFIITSIISDSGRKRVSSAQDMINLLKDVQGEEIVVLGMFPDGTEYYFEIKVN